MKLVEFFGLPRTIVTYFSWYFCSQISPEIQVITAAGEANYTLITKTAKVDLPWEKSPWNRKLTETMDLSTILIIAVRHL